MSYYRFLWKSHRSFLLFGTIVIALLQFVILKLVADFGTEPIVMGLLEQIPANVKAMFGQEAFSMLSVENAAAFGLSHPLVLVILSIAALTIPSRHLAGEAETGTLELVLSFPVTRVALLLKLFASAAVYLLIIVFFALCSSLLSISIFHRLTIDLFARMTQIGCNLWLLFVCIMSFTTMLSSFEKEGMKVGIRVAGITLVFYLLHYLSALWDALRFTKPFNIFTYYQPTELMTGQRSFLQHVVVLSSLIGLCLAVSVYQFQRRDIPG